MPLPREDVCFCRGPWDAVVGPVAEKFFFYAVRADVGDGQKGENLP